MNTADPVINIGQFSYFPRHSLGKGATGEVFQGRNNYTHETVAIKVVDLREIDTPRKRQLLDCEINGLRSVHHPFVIKTFEITQDNDHLYIPMECCPNGTLRDYIKSKKYLQENQALGMFQKIVEGYCEIVRSGYIHRDLKTQNILLRKNMEPVIIDFGYCEKKLSYNVGSPAYMSPEAYNDSMYSEKSDVWALGVILHEMTTGTIPKMWTMDVNRYFRELANQQVAIVVPAYQSQFCMQLLYRMLTVNMNVRPCGEQIKNMIKSRQCFSPIPEKQTLKNRTRSMQQIPLTSLKSLKSIPNHYNPSQKFSNTSQHYKIDDGISLNTDRTPTENYVSISENFIPSPTKMSKNNGVLEMGHKPYHAPDPEKRKNRNFEAIRNKITSNRPLLVKNQSHQYPQEVVMTPGPMKHKQVSEVYSPYQEPHSALQRPISTNLSTQSPVRYKQGSYPENISSFDSPLRKSFPVKLRREISAYELPLNRI